MNHSIDRLGEVRASQLLWTFGPGALIDLPNLSVLTRGLQDWPIQSCQDIYESRLLNAVRSILGDQVQSLHSPPVDDSDGSMQGKASSHGVPVVIFPRWLRCVRCGLLASVDSGLFQLKGSSFRPDQIHFVHTNCEKGKNSDAVPARFLLACRDGHLDDFPWHWFVHGGRSTCRGTLRFFESGASLQAENLLVKCDGCGATKSLAQAYGEEGRRTLPRCRGCHPHLGNCVEECGADPVVVLLGASNTWFPVTISVLSIPETDSLSKLVEDAWEDLKEADSLDELKVITKLLIKGGRLSGIEDIDPERIWSAIQQKRSQDNETENGSTPDVVLPEWKVLTSDRLPNDWPHFLAERVAPPRSYSQRITQVVQLKRLREVNALVGFTRVEALGESTQTGNVKKVPLCSGKPKWVPAVEVHGEGIFLRFDEERVCSWESRKEVKEREGRIRGGYREWCGARGLDGETGFPGIRYVMLHTFSHVLIRELALECGYDAGSVRERIYASSDPAHPMAGILIYTAAPDSEGTLGGLVELAKPEKLERLIEQALKRASICSSDPLCSEHDPIKDRSLHAAACHACSFLSETSCERSNRFLDRATIIQTFHCSNLAFFG